MRLNDESLSVEKGPLQIEVHIIRPVCVCQEECQRVNVLTAMQFTAKLLM